MNANSHHLWLKVLVFTVLVPIVTIFLHTEISSASVKIDSGKADNSGNTWDGSVAKSFEGGDGSKNNPYLIKTGAQLAFLAAQVNSDKVNGYEGKYFKLTSDIKLSGHQWKPIAGFNGVFDGDHKNIIGFSINSINSLKEDTNLLPSVLLGLFSFIKEKASILNLNLIDAKIIITSPKGQVINEYEEEVSIKLGTLVGLNRGTITNCTLSGQINIVPDVVVGGFVGENWGTISDSTSSLTINISGSAGGIVGVNGATNDGMGGELHKEGFISNCKVTGNVSGNSMVGGLVAWSELGKVSNCTVTGNVYGVNEMTSGLIGYMDASTVVSNCKATGKVIKTNK
jgi:hypothetical protein